jgi:hypothetical protein
MGHTGRARRTVQTGYGETGHAADFRVRGQLAPFIAGDAAGSQPRGLAVGAPGSDPA